MYFSTIFEVLKMFYQFLWLLMTCFSFVFNILWLCCNFASIGIPWLTLLFIIICIVSKFVKLKKPANETLATLLSKSYQIGSEVLYWPIANRGGAFDAPENSIAAINQCISQNCNNILLDLSMTSEGEMVILHKSTLEKANINDPIAKLKLNVLNHLNLSDYHPLGQHFKPEKIITLSHLMKVLESSDVTVYLLASHTNAKMIESIKQTIKMNDNFTKRFVFCCKSPIAIYQLRQTHPNLVCGLWMEKSSLSKAPQYFNTSTIYMSIYGAIFRNIISPVIGINLVFINKDEFNAQISTLWQNVGVRPIVYTINSPNEKRYFQQVTKTHYLTDSLRSEPQIIFKTKRK